MFLPGRFSCRIRSLSSKWVLSVRFSTYFPGYFDAQDWPWRVFLVSGFLLFLRGFFSDDTGNFLLLASPVFVWSVQFLVCTCQDKVGTGLELKETYRQGLWVPSMLAFKENPLRDG